MNAILEQYKDKINGSLKDFSAYANPGVAFHTHASLSQRELLAETR